MSYSSEVLADSPLVYWKLAEASGTTMVDSSGNARDGAYTASPTLGQTGPFSTSSDTAVLFNGTTQYGNIAFASWMNGMSTLTIEAWVKTTATAGTIFGRGASPANYRIGLTSGKAFFETRTTSTVLVTGTSTINDGNWHYICGRWTGTTMILEVDGAQENTGTTSGGLLAASNPLRVAQRASDSFLAGTVAQCALYGTNIGPTRMAAHYAAGRAVILSGGHVTETDTPRAGSVSSGLTVSGGHVSETDAGRAGSAKVGARVSGGHVTETDTGRAGTMLSGQSVAGGHVSETDTAHPATLRLILGGGHASEADTGHAGAQGFSVPGGHGTETDTAHGGVIAVTIPGGTAHETDTPHGHPSGATSGGHAAEVVTLYPGAVVLGYGTAKKVRVGGRRRSGLGVGFWEPAVTTAPATVTYGDERVIAHAFTVPDTSGPQPQFDVISADEPQHRDRILVGGVDITYFRGALTPTPTYQLVEPLLYGPATLSLPQVAACFEQPGVGALSWLKPGKTVKVQRVDRETNAVVATDYVGVVIAFDVDGADLTVQIGGEASGRAALRHWPIPIFRSTHDIGRWVYHAMHSLGVRFKPYLGPDTGIELARFGGTGHLDYISQLCARAQNRDGAQWTVTKTGDHYEMVRKDRATVHGTVYLDDARAVPGRMRRDTAEEPTRIYGTGTTPEGQRILGGIYPGVQKTDPAEYPFRDGRSFGLGTQDADTDTGDGVTVMVARLRVCRYMGAADAPGGYDRDVVRAVKALQDDAGLAETGDMNQATWNALYDVGTTGPSLRWSKVVPLAQKPYTREWRRSGSGAIMGRNPNYDPSRLVVDRDIDFGSGFTHKQMREWARDEIDQSEDNWVGDITLHSGAVVAGDHTPGDPITSILRARDIKPGMNLSLPLFAGGILVHVSAVSVDSDGLVTCSVDTRARDSLEVWEIIARNRETRRSPARAWEHQYRASGMTHDVVDGWSEVGGELGTRTALHGGEWNIVEVVAGQVGTIQRLTLDTNPNAEYAVAIFGAKISAATLNHRIGNPLTATGKDKWSDETVRAILNRDHLLLYAAGDDGSPCGYWPKQKQGDHPLTGKFRDDAGFSYATQQYPVLYVAIYPDRNTSIPAGRIMYPQLEAGA